MALRSRSSRLKAGTSSISAPARSRLAGATNRFRTELPSTQSSIGVVAEEHVVHRGLERPDVDPQAGAGVALRIEIDDQGAVAELGQAGAEVDRGGGLADATLLVGDGDDPGERPAGRGGLRPPLISSSTGARSARKVDGVGGRRTSVRRRIVSIRRCASPSDGPRSSEPDRSEGPAEAGGRRDGARWLRRGRRRRRRVLRDFRRRPTVGQVVVHAPHSGSGGSMSAAHRPRAKVPRERNGAILPAPGSRVKDPRPDVPRETPASRPSRGSRTVSSCFT